MAGRSRIRIGLPVLWFCRAAQAVVQAYELTSIQFRKCWLHSDLEIAGARPLILPIKSKSLVVCYQRLAEAKQSF